LTLRLDFVIEKRQVERVFGKFLVGVINHALVCDHVKVYQEMNYVSWKKYPEDAVTKLLIEKLDNNFNVACLEKFLVSDL